MKRDLWTNEEVMDFLEGFKISGKNPDAEHCTIWNAAMQNAKEEFSLFTLDPSISGAMGYDEKTNQIVHIGTELPR